MFLLFQNNKNMLSTFMFTYHGKSAAIQRAKHLLCIAMLLKIIICKRIMWAIL